MSNFLCGHFVINQPLPIKYTVLITLAFEASLAVRLESVLAQQQAGWAQTIASGATVGVTSVPVPAVLVGAFNSWTGHNIWIFLAGACWTVIRVSLEAKFAMFATDLATAASLAFSMKAGRCHGGDHQ